MGACFQCQDASVGACFQCQDASADAIAGLTRRAVEDHHGLQIGVELEGVLAALTTDAADPDTTERGVSGGGSTGLGLDIARSTAERVGGSFAVRQSDLGGAEAAMLLPLLTDGQT